MCCILSVNFFRLCRREEEKKEKVKEKEGEGRRYNTER